MRKSLLLLSFLVTGLILQAQSSSSILEDAERFKSFGTVLYMAAHPDDENTRVIAWLVNGEHAKTGYLSLTRGDGGQNLIGKEFGDALGILRTQELLSARSIDGGEQYFTSAVDFGYSRNADETLEKWGEENILADVVYMIRKFKPQVIITRFPPDERAGHGHHTASAMLAIKGAEMASDPSQFAYQLNEVSLWQVQSVYWNTSTWWDKTVADEMDTNTSIWRADIGGYNANMGVSFNEIGSLARSQHKCQGFGATISRGETFEYFRHLWGEKLNNGLADIKQPTWADLGLSKMAKQISQLEREFNPRQPQNSIDILLDIYKKLDAIEDTYWRERKKEECANLILQCGGLFYEAIADNYFYKLGEENAPVTVNLLSRQTDRFSIDGLRAPGGGMTFKAPAQLAKNIFSTFEIAIEVPNELTNPYWLASPHGNTYDKSKWNAEIYGKAQNPPTMAVKTSVLIGDISIPLTIPVTYKWRDRVVGEEQRGVVVVPPYTVSFDQPVFVSVADEAIKIKTTINWFAAEGDFNVKFSAPGWNISIADEKADESLTMLATSPGAEREEEFTLYLTPKEIGNQGELKVLNEKDEEVRGFQEIAYSHIPTQAFMPENNVKLTSLDVAIRGEKVAYIQGAGDQVAEGIAQLGYQVDIIDETTISGVDLNQYQAVVIGIRAYNTQAWLQNHTDKFFAYIKQGGNFIVQYNTASRFLDDKPLIPAPYEFDLGRGRVTEEDSDVEFLLPEHQIFNSPNKITQADFSGWTQERGLYFASKWDEHYVAPIGWNDTGREQEKGGLIIANYGEGAFIYTGISFFRVLASGQPGPFRILANLISYEAETTNQ